MSNIGRLTVGSLIGGLLVAILLLPFAAVVGLGATQVADAVEGTDSINMDLPAPERTTILASDGQPIAYLFNQNRKVVPIGDISQYLQDAIQSIEDRRFLQHRGVDWRGTARAALGQLTGEAGTGGGSTITQQYVKNYQFLVAAKTDAEKAQAIEVSPIRKLREARLAINFEQTHTKLQILEAYLNTVAFGPSVYGAEAASWYYFGHSAKDLQLGEAAMLAGMVQNPVYLNPFITDRVEDVKQRRDRVLDTLLRDRKYSAAVIDPLKGSDLPLNRTSIPNGCIASDGFGDVQGSGFFCQYVVDYLENLPSNPFTDEQLRNGGYTITSTLDRTVMQNAIAAVTAVQGGEATARIANVMAVVEPNTQTPAKGRPVLALAANQPYGLGDGQTVQRLPTTFAPLGAGSTFKIFTAAAAMQRGLGTQDVIDVPADYTSNLQPGSLVTNPETFPSTLTLQQALATSPNTAFVALEDQVGLKSVVDMAVGLGLRGYKLDAGDVEPGFSDVAGSYADLINQQRISSFTLGVSPTSPLELANVGASLASDGQWCPPTPVKGITDRTGASVDWATIPCDQPLEPKLARTLTQALTEDAQDGTSSASFQAAGWPDQAVAGKTGTTQQYKSSAFLGYTPLYSSSVVVWDFLSKPQSICVEPLRSCTFEEIEAGTARGMSGGSVPAATWTAAMKPLVEARGKTFFEPADPVYRTGTTKTVPNLSGKSVAEAEAALVAEGFVPAEVERSDPAAPGTLLFYTPTQSAVEGATVTLRISSGPAA